MDKPDYRWAAGFLDGEGNFSFHKSHKHLILYVTQKDPRVLYKLQSILGGRILGPYHKKTKTNNLDTWIYRYRLGQGLLLEVIDDLWPYLGEVKREQYLRGVDLLKTGKTERVQMRASRGPF